MQYPFEKLGTGETKKGLFVIVKQQMHRFSYDPSKRSDYWWDERLPLDYGTDEEAILRAFGLKRGLVNVLLGENRTNNSGGEASFDYFMSEEVCKHGIRNGQNPSFVMFFLMSHGFENGDFLLADHGISGQSKPQCCSQEMSHTLKGSCFARNIVDDVIAKVHNSYTGIPKVFIIQCCRGSGERNLETRDPLLPNPPNPSEGELFVSKQADTLVLRASVEGYMSYVRTESPANRDTDLMKGSMLLQSFCEAIEEIRDNHEQYQRLISELQAHGNAQDELLKSLKQRREDITGGWVMNVCQRTTSLVTTKIIVELVLPKSRLGDLLSVPWNKLNTRLKDTPTLTKRKLTDSLRTVADRLSIPTEVVELMMGECDTQPRPILAYLWANVRRLSATFPLQLSNITPEDKQKLVKEHLNRIIEDTQNPEAYCKQQPHVSSSLSKKLSVINILLTQ